MKSILIIIPFFGKFNNYFNLFLKSVENNNTIDFLIITDDKRKFNYPKNVKVIYSTFEEEAKRITNFFNFNAKCDVPYKICDYRPFLGSIYSEYAKDYDFWGQCDTDLIFGNIRHFITDEILNFYEKIYIKGHLSLIKNDGKVERTLLESKVFQNIWHCKEVFADGEAMYHYDEYNGSLPTLFVYKTKIYDSIDISNIDPRYSCFYMCNWDRYCFFKNQKLILVYKDKKLICINEKGKKRETVYVHLQKRKMINNLECPDEFIIIPNKFICYDGNFSVKNEFLRQNELEKINPKNDYFYLTENNQKTFYKSKKCYFNNKD